MGLFFRQACVGSARLSGGSRPIPIVARGESVAQGKAKRKASDRFVPGLFQIVGVPEARIHTECGPQIHIGGETHVRETREPRGHSQIQVGLLLLPQAGSPAQARGENLGSIHLLIDPGPSKVLSHVLEGCAPPHFLEKSPITQLLIHSQVGGHAPVGIAPPTRLHVDCGSGEKLRIHRLGEGKAQSRVPSGVLIRQLVG